MGMLRRIFKARRAAKTAAKAQIKAAQARAKAEVKHQKKLELKSAKILDRQHKRIEKAERKNLKIKTRHQARIAKQTLKRVKQRRITAKTVGRWVSAARMLAPLALPVIYRTLVAADKTNKKSRATFTSTPRG